jgi:tRNA uridine 5-carbamoylmethylation protein Kti12
MTPVPCVYILIGLPGTGKTTFRNALVSSQLDRKITVLSFDDIIIRAAAVAGTTFEEIHRREMRRAKKQVEELEAAAYAANHSVVWDALNLTKNTRIARLSAVPAHYNKFGLIFPVPSWQVHRERCSKLPGNIHGGVISRLRGTYEEPSLAEGFTSIFNYIGGKNTGSAWQVRTG